MIPKFSGLKQKHFLPHSFSGSGFWVCFSWVLWLELKSSCWPGWLAQKAWLGKDVLQSSSSGCWQDWVPCGPLNWVLSLLAVGRRPPSVLCDMCLSTGKLTTWQLASSEQQGRRTKERMRARKKSVLYNLNLEVTSITSAMFCLLEASRYVQTTPKGRITQGSNPRGEDHWEPF